MKKLIKSSLVLAVLFAALTNLTSCEKDEGKLPNISFKTGSTYVSADQNIAAGASFTIGINASKSESEDVLKTLNVSKAINGGTSSTVETITLTGTQGDSYSNDFAYTAGTAGTTEKYTFTVTNRDGLTNQVSVTLTVQ